MSTSKRSKLESKPSKKPSAERRPSEDEENEASDPQQDEVLL